MRSFPNEKFRYDIFAMISRRTRSRCCASYRRGGIIDRNEPAVKDTPIGRFWLAWPFVTSRNVVPPITDLFIEGCDIEIGRCRGSGWHDENAPPRRAPQHRAEMLTSCRMHPIASPDALFMKIAAPTAHAFRELDRERPDNDYPSRATLGEPDRVHLATLLIEERPHFP